MAEQINHQQAVSDFFYNCKKNNPNKYAEVCSRYPVMSHQRLVRIRQQETTVGLLGLQASRISRALSDRYDSFKDDEDE